MLTPKMEMIFETKPPPPLKRDHLKSSMKRALGCAFNHYILPLCSHHIFPVFLSHSNSNSFSFSFAVFMPFSSALSLKQQQSQFNVKQTMLWIERYGFFCNHQAVSVHTRIFCWSKWNEELFHQYTHTRSVCTHIVFYIMNFQFGTL